MRAEDLVARGDVRLLDTLPNALTGFAQNQTVRGWFPDDIGETYMVHQAGELAHLAEMTAHERCAVYAQVYQVGDRVSGTGR